MTKQKRFCILTIGKTHSGKSTFARKLEQVCSNCIVIDQDIQAEFLQSTYPKLVPTDGENLIKYALSETIVQYAMLHTNLHLILCNANLSDEGRAALMKRITKEGFKVIIVKFDIPYEVLKERVRTSNRDATILRTIDSYEDLLERQKKLILPENLDRLHQEFVVRCEKDVAGVIQSIKGLLEG